MKSLIENVLDFLMNSCFLVAGEREQISKDNILMLGVHIQYINTLLIRQVDRMKIVKKYAT